MGFKFPKPKDIIKPVLAPITKIVDSVKCSIKLTTNFQKCVGFYALDVLKYTIFFLPLLLYSTVSRTNMKTNAKWLDNQVRWSDKTMNDCYLCKNKKKKKNNNKSGSKKKNKNGKGFINGKDGKNGSGHGFFYFLFILIFVALPLLCIYYFSNRSSEGESNLILTESPEGEKKIISADFRTR